jgi:voltage-gated potassium channel Kch
MVCDLLDKKFIPYVAFDVNPAKVIEARNRGLPVFFGDVSRPEVLRSFNVDKARAVIITTNEMRATNKAVVTLRKLYPKMPIFARAADLAHQKRLQNTLEVSAMVPILPEDSVLLSLPFGGRVLRKMGVSPEEVDVLMDDMRKKALSDIFGVREETEGEEIIGVIQSIKKQDAVAAQTLSQQQQLQQQQQLLQQQQQLQQQQLLLQQQQQQQLQQGEQRPQPQ